MAHTIPRTIAVLGAVLAAASMRSAVSSRPSIPCGAKGSVVVWRVASG